MSAELSLSQQMDESVVPLGTKNGIKLAILRRSKKTLGEVIGQPDSPDLIEGVRIEPLQIHPDDRGFFGELTRLGEGLATKMLPEGDRRIQVSFTLTYPGIIKAIHFHSDPTIAYDWETQHK